MRSVPIAEEATPWPPLIRMVDWAHHLLTQVLDPGDLAVDLTAGRGRDTLFLFRRTGLSGRVLAFDIQEDALIATTRLLEDAGATVRLHRQPPTDPLPPGVHLFHASHALLDQYLPASPKAVIANLGYLPGGNPDVATRADSTLAALDQAFLRLASGGRLALTAYLGQSGGQEEGEAVSARFAALSSLDWRILRLEVPNRPTSPFLLLAQKR
ncbi:MAG: class I SAM-dependent methyltransferase [Desulfuromonadales bacterium]